MLIDKGLAIIQIIIETAKQYLNALYLLAVE